MGESVSRTSHVKIVGKSSVWVCHFCGEKISYKGKALKDICKHAATSSESKGCAQVSEEALQDLMCAGVDEADGKLSEVLQEDKARKAQDEAAAKRKLREDKDEAKRRKTEEAHAQVQRANDAKAAAASSSAPVADNTVKEKKD